MFTEKKSWIFCREFWQFFVPAGVSLTVDCSSFDVPTGKGSEFEVVERDMKGSGNILHEERELQMTAVDGQLSYTGVSDTSRDRFFRFNVRAHDHLATKKSKKRKPLICSCMAQAPTCLSPEAGSLAPWGVTVAWNVDGAAAPKWYLSSKTGNNCG